MKQALLYSFKVWLTAAITTPLIFMIITQLSTGGYTEPVGDYISFYLACVFFGLMCSLFPFLIILLLIYRLQVKGVKSSRIKGLVLIVGEVLIGVLMIGWDAYEGTIDLYTFRLWIPYAVIVGCFIWLFKLNPLKKKLDADT